MSKLAKTACAVALLALIASPLSACANNQAAANVEEEEATTQLDESVRAEIEAKLAQAREANYNSVAFNLKTETIATSRDEDGQTQQQSVVTTMKGELDKSQEKPALHMKFESASNVQLEKTSYDMYVDQSGIIVAQGDQMFKNLIDDKTLQGYVNSVVGVGSETEVKELLDVASSYKLEEKDGDTVITIVADVKKLEQSSLIDTSSLPNSSSVATLVASYTIGSDNRLKAVRLMSSTSGMPTYRVDQSYQYSDYDTAKLPEWPDINAYIAEQSGILTDENGRMYIIGDDGLTYYVESIADDGTVYFEMPSTGTYYDGDYLGDLYEYMYIDPSAYDTGTDQQSTSSGTTGTTTGSTTNGGVDKGRPYITVDGKQHFLDEEGARTVQTDDGILFFPADGSDPVFIVES